MRSTRIVWRLHRAALPAFFYVLWGTRIAHAEDAPSPTDTATPPRTEERALALFKESEDAYREARFQESLRLLDEAYALRPEPVLLYNMARVHETMGDLDRAIPIYERYLAEASDVPDRRALEARIGSLEALREERRRNAAADPRLPPRPKNPSRTVVPWIVAGAGGLVLAGSGVVGLVAEGRESDAMTDPIQQSAVRARDDATTWATVANVGFVVGGALAIGGLVWGIVTATRGASTTAAALPWKLEGHF